MNIANLFMVIFNKQIFIFIKYTVTCNTHKPLLLPKHIFSNYKNIKILKTRMAYVTSEKKRILLIKEAENKHQHQICCIWFPPPTFKILQTSYSVWISLSFAFWFGSFLVDSSQYTNSMYLALVSVYLRFL